jgi:hypothetical protein
MSYTKLLTRFGGYIYAYGRYTETSNGGFREITDAEWEQYTWVDVTCHNHPVQRVYKQAGIRATKDSYAP